MSDKVIKIENLSKKYIISHQRQQRYTTLRDVVTGKANNLFKRFTRPFVSNNSSFSHPTVEEFWALKDISFEIKQGDKVGIIGINGAGKSTLLKLLSRITEPTAGRFEITGRVASLLEVGTGFHPELTGRENIFLNGAILGMTKLDIKRKFDEIVDFAEIEKFLDIPVKRYSSGMYVRLAFAVAAHLEPEILIVDEVLSVGDAAFQKKCLGKMGDVAKGGRTVLFVSHNLGAVQQLTNSSLLLHKGKLLSFGETSQIVEKYLEMISTKKSQMSVNTNLTSNDENFIIHSFGINLKTLEPGFNKPLHFEFNLFLKKAIDDIAIGIMIENSIGAKILVSRCTIDKLSTGDKVINYSLENHHLPPGNYSVRLGIEISSTPVIFEGNILNFEISDQNFSDPFITSRRDKLGIYIPAKYSIQSK